MYSPDTYAPARTPITSTLRLRPLVTAAALFAAALASDALAQSITAGPWSGNVTSSSASINAALSGSGIVARVAASTSFDLSNPVYSPAVTSSSTSGNAVRLELGGLAANTTYYYAVELDGALQTSGDLKGTLKTHPGAGARSFKISFASCGDYNNTSQYVYEAVRNESPLFFIHMGDMNYQDINSTNPDNYRAVYTNQLTLGGLRTLVRHVPLAYVWDDHDYSGNDSNKTALGRAASRQVYRERVPHYPLPAGGPDAAIYQSFTVGRVKFILSDLRSERDPATLVDDANKSIMGSVQKQWFKDELIAARDAAAPLIVWVSSVPFISTSTSQDNWGSYTTERAELLTFIRDNNVKNVVILSGDMHALAVDDGAGTSGYVSEVRIPVFHAAALARGGSTKGGPYSVDGVTVSPSAGLGRFANLVISDDGSTLTATYEGRIASGSGSTLTGVSTWRSYTYTSVPVTPTVGVAYSLVNKSGLELAVAADTQNNANVVAESPSTDADHYWQIVATDGGYFSLKNKKSGQWANVSGAPLFTGANVATWPDNSNEDHYELRSIDDGSGHLKLQFRHSGLMLATFGNTGGTNVEQATDGTADRLRWQLVSQGDGYHKIVQKTTGLELALAHDTQNNGNVVAEAASTESDHLWTLENATAGYYYLKNSRSNAYLNVSGGYATTGANVAQWNAVGGDHYLISLVRMDGDYYNLVLKHSGKVVTALGTSPGTNVQQGGTDGSSDRAQWRFKR